MECAQLSNCKMHTPKHQYFTHRTHSHQMCEMERDSVKGGVSVFDKLLHKTRFRTMLMFNEGKPKRFIYGTKISTNYRNAISV